VFNPTTYNPRWRSLQAQKQSMPSDDDWILRYRGFLVDPESSDDEVIQTAHSFRVDSWFQSHIEALLLAEAPVDFCAQYFGIDEGVITAYANIFYDLSPVIGHGSRAVMVEKWSKQGSSDRRFKECAVRYGLDVLRWVFGDGVILSEDQIRGLYARVEQSMIMRLQQIEQASPGNKVYTDLIKTVDAAIKLRESMKKLESGYVEDGFLETLRQHLNATVEPTFDRMKVLERRAGVGRN